MADAFAALAGDRRDTCKHGRLLARAGAQLGEVGDQDGGGHRSDAWNGHQDDIAAGELRYSPDPSLDLGVETLEMTFWLR